MTTIRIPALGLWAALFFSASVQAAVDGPALYKEHCAKCHAETGQADNWRGYLYFARNFSSPEWQKKMSDANILDEINDGPRIMPSYQDSLNSEQKAAIIKVIRGFGGLGVPQSTRDVLASLAQGVWIEDYTDRCAAVSDILTGSNTP